MNTGKYIKLNSSAEFIFKKIEQGMNQSDIIDAILMYLAKARLKQRLPSFYQKVLVLKS